jgi:hypothetical protein
LASERVPGSQVPDGGGVGGAVGAEPGADDAPPPQAKTKVDATITAAVEIDGKEN